MLIHKTGTLTLSILLHSRKMENGSRTEKIVHKNEETFPKHSRPKQKHFDVLQSFK